MRERFELREGKWGMYFHDTYNGNDLPLKEVLDFLNAKSSEERGSEVGSARQTEEEYDEKLHKIVDSYKFEDSEEPEEGLDPFDDRPVRKDLEGEKEKLKARDKDCYNDEWCPSDCQGDSDTPCPDSEPSKPKDFYLGEKGFVVIEPKGGDK